MSTPIYDYNKGFFRPGGCLTQTGKPNRTDRGSGMT